MSNAKLACPLLRRGQTGTRKAHDLYIAQPAHGIDVMRGDEAWPDQGHAEGLHADASRFGASFAPAIAWVPLDTGWLAISPPAAWLPHAMYSIT
jgi:hypothetical protein